MLLESLLQIKLVADLIGLVMRLTVAVLVPWERDGSSCQIKSGPVAHSAISQVFACYNTYKLNHGLPRFTWHTTLLRPTCLTCPTHWSIYWTSIRNVSGSIPSYQFFLFLLFLLLFCMDAFGCLVHLELNWNYLFIAVPFNSCVVSCRPSVDITIFWTGLVFLSPKGNHGRPS